MAATCPARKLQAFYWSFAEFGPDRLSKEHFWLVGGVLRSSLAASVAGGMSCVFKYFLKQFFRTTWNFETTGVSVPLSGGGSAVIVAKLSTIVADESALKSLWASKGASGLKPCMLCKNVLKARTGLTEVADDYFVDVSVTSLNMCDPHTDGSVREAVDLLADSAPRLSKKAFDELSKTLGMGWHKEMTLFDQSLRPHVLPVSNTMFDQMHVYLANGLVNFELFDFMAVLKQECKLSYPDLFSFCSPWRWPKFVQSKPADVFNSKREASSKETFKAGASELLSVYSVVRHFIESILEPSGFLAAQIASALALFNVLDALVCMKRGLVTADRLEAAIVRHLQLYQAAYPDSYVKPKHHQALHLASQMRSHGELFSCFVHERRHKTLKKYASTTTNTTCYEETVSMCLLNAHVEAMRQPETFLVGSYLVRPKAI